MLLLCYRLCVATGLSAVRFNVQLDTSCSKFSLCPLVSVTLYVIVCTERIWGSLHLLRYINPLLLCCRSVEVSSQQAEPAPAAAATASLSEVSAIPEQDTTQPASSTFESSIKIVQGSVVKFQVYIQLCAKILFADVLRHTAQNDRCYKLYTCLLYTSPSPRD